MARKNVISPFRLIADGDMSGDFTSEPIIGIYQDNIGFQVNWTGAAVSGEYFIEGTNYDLKDPNTSPVWTPLDFGLQMLIASDTDDSGDLINVNQFPFNALRFRYEATSGTGTMQVQITSKVTGG